MVAMALRAFVCVLLVAVHRVASDNAVQFSDTFGGPHGTEFSDEASVVAGETVSFITIRAGARVDGISMGVSSPTAQTFTHGGSGGTDNTLTLATGEYITSMVAHWGKKDGHTRIFYLSFGTSAGNSISGGTQTDSAGSTTAPEGYQLAGFYGQDGDEIDLLGAIWASIDATTESPATVAPTNDSSASASTSVEQNSVDQTDLSTSVEQNSVTQTDLPPASSTGSSAQSSGMDDGTLIVSESPSTTAPASASSGSATRLSQSFGGPHGTEFSDLSLATSGQTITSLTIRAGDRVDGLTLQVSAPTAQTFTHGGTGGRTTLSRSSQASTSRPWRFTGAKRTGTRAFST